MARDATVLTARIKEITETLQRVRSLMSHPAFSMLNPNRVRALVGTFASANQTGFNRADGAGLALFIACRNLEFALHDGGDARGGFHGGVACMRPTPSR